MLTWPFSVTSLIEISVSIWALNLPCWRSGVTVLTTSHDAALWYLKVCETV